jgi:hypothetical protein
MPLKRGVSKMFGEWYQKTNITEDTNKLTLLVFKIIAILHNTLLETFIKLLETVSKGLFRNRSQNHCHMFLDCRHVRQNVRLLWCSSGGETERSPPYSLALAPAGARFADVAAIQERVTAVLRSFPKEAFADSFQKLYECCQQGVVKDSDYFEGQ